MNFNFQNSFLHEREKIFSDESLSNHSLQFCVKYSSLVDNFIVELLESEQLESAIIAVGGYCRRELSPHSDIDLMFISPNIKENEKEIQKCITKLWDAGIEVSHTIRELSDIEEFLETDLHAFTQFFETRFLLGNKNLYDEWNSILLKLVEKSNKEKLIHQYYRDNKLRHKKYGKSPKVLEPNIKFTCGGLRDIHLIEWIYLIVNQRLLPDINTKTHTEIFFEELLNNSQIILKSAQDLISSYQFILKARNLLHLVDNKKGDKLVFDLQKSIALKLGYSIHNWKEFMHEYFHATVIVNRFSMMMMKKFMDDYSSEIHTKSFEDLDNDFELIGNIIKYKNDKKLSRLDIMRAFYYKCSHNARFDQNLRSTIIESIDLINSNNSLCDTTSKYFRKMLKLPNNVGKTLLSMNEYGFLELIITEFKKLNGFFQPGNYHCYTADEHTLIAMQNLENLLEEEVHLVDVFNSLQSRDLLYISILLHDIAKPISITGHEIIGAEISKNIMYNLGYNESDNEIVQFLVKHHLEMPQIAFRRDLNDPMVLNNFLSIIPSIEALDLLYLLSYADLSAVNPRVWTSWKSGLLFELYSNSKSMLIKQLTGEELIDVKMDNFLHKNNNSDDLMNEHLGQVDDSKYLFHFTQNEIIQHINQINNRTEISIFFKINDSFTNITVITKDSSSLLAKLCGAFVINDLNIHDAKIFTRKDGIVIDSFNVTDFRTHKLVDENMYKKIRSRIKNAVSGKLDIVQEIKSSQYKWRRLVHRLNNTEIQLEVEFEEHDKYNIIDISVPDKIGLLYNITKKLSDLQLSLAFAKISTKVDGVIDAFYVTKNNGNKIKPSEYQYIRSELMNEIKSIL